MTTEAPTTEATEALTERLFAAAIGTLELASVHVGGQLGLYRSLADDGPGTNVGAASSATERRSLATRRRGGALRRDSG